MKHKYIIVKKDGSIEEPEQYIKKSCIDKDLRILIEREALGVKASKKENKPEYLKYANKMGFNWEKNADIGFVNYNHKADLIKRLVKEYSRMLVNNIGFPIYEISGSNFFDMEHPVVKSYANLYSERLFKHKQGRKEYLMLYDASYPQFNLASDYQLSHKNLPFAHFSISDCYRYEQRGECMLLFRGRRFNMPDLHPYLKNIDEAFEWYFKIEEQILSAVKELKHNYVNVIKVSSIKSWEEYKDKIVNIPVKSKKDMLVEIRMDGVDRYWIIDVDYSIIDAMEQPREIGCIQIDIGNAKRLGIKYINEKNQKVHPVIIHAAVPGGIERFIYMLFDRFQEVFPLWLHPIQVRLLPISEKYLQFCEKIIEENKSIRIDIDDRSLPIGKKIEKVEDELIPLNFVIGEKELMGEGNIPNFKQAASEILKSSKNKPFLPFSWPDLVSKQVV